MSLTRILRLTTALILLASFPIAAQEQTPIKLIRDAALSPDGASIAFSWRGDIWSATAVGGPARRLTSHPASDRQPAFSPDGSEIAFVSSRTGSTQIFVMPAGGGRPERITHHTEGYSLTEWTPDGKGFLVSASRDHFWRSAARLFIQPRDGTRAPELLFNGYGRSASLSSDGQQLLFTREGTGTYRKQYTGSQESQIWEYDRKTKRFTKLHGQGQGGCRWPLWTGDSTYVYVNQSTGTWNLFQGQTGTAAPKQLTDFADDGVLFPTVSRDGTTVVFLRGFDLHRLDLRSGKVTRIELHDAGDPTVAAEKRVTLDRATGAAFTKDGREIAFTSGGDLWVMDTVLKEPVRVTRTPEEETNPIFALDHKTLYFISDTDGNTDIWKATRKNGEKHWWQNETFQLERLTNDAASERGLRLWDSGKRLSFTANGGDVVSLELESGKQTTLISSWNSPTYDFSPDGKWIAYAVSDNNYNSDIWIKPIDGSEKPFNVSCHPDNDGSPRWSPDGKILAFTGRRWGTETDIAWVYLAKKKNEETSRQRTLEEALKKMKGRKKKKGGSKAASNPTAAKEKPTKQSDPSGTWDTVIEGPEGVIPGGRMQSELELLIADGGRLTATYTTPDGESSDLSGTFDPKTGKLHLEGDTGQGRIVVRGTFSGNTINGTWEFPDAGVGGTWSGERSGTPDKKPDAGVEAKKKKGDKKKDAVKVQVDFEGLRDRIRRIRIPDSTERGLIWAPEGQKLYFQARVKNKSGVHSVEFPKKLTPKFWTTTIGRASQWLEGKKLATLSRGLPAIAEGSGKLTTYGFKIKDTVDVAAKNQVIFDMAWRTMRDRFYDERLGNNDWDAIRKKYRAVAATLDSDVLRTVSSMMMGELNASHLGFSLMSRGTSAPRTNDWNPTTGHLGTRFDASHQGPGLLVKDVVSDSPAWREDSRIEPGEIILTIDGQPVDPGLEVATVLTGKLDRDVLLQVRNKEGEDREVTIRPTTYRSVRSRLYKDWIDANRKKVDELSGGTLGYLHIRSMGGGNLQTFDAELYRIGDGKDGLLIDVRENGGGSITDHLLTCLCQPTHAITRSRGGGEGYPQDRRIYASWDKPIVVLCNQNSFSNAEIFSHAVKTLKRGQVVGVPTAGGVISTGGAFLLGSARVRLPTRGWYTLDGNDMELQGCVPHHTLWPQPTEIPSGIDHQLAKAAEVLSADVKKWKSRPRPRLRKAAERR